MNDFTLAAKRLREFLSKASHLKHPDVKFYGGTVNGDTPEKWEARLYLAAIEYAMAKPEKGEFIGYYQQTVKDGKTTYDGPVSEELMNDPGVVPLYK